MRLRAHVLSEEPLCRICLQFDLVAEASEVDHIVPLVEGGSDDRSNLQGVCRPCHQAKTAREARRGRS